MQIKAVRNDIAKLRKDAADQKNDHTQLATLVEVGDALECNSSANS